MKTIVQVLLFLIISYHVNATIRTATGNTGNGWSVAGNWSASGVPQDGDTVLIPAGATMTVKSNIYSTLPNLVIKVYGILHFAPGGKLDLGPASIINIYTNGLITSTGSPSSVITIGGVNKYSGNSDGTIVGPAFANSASGVSPTGFGQGILPVKFQSFLVKVNAKQQAQLNWIVSNEEQIHNYNIEKSTDARNWRVFYTQPSANSNETIKSYSYIDSFPANGVSYYRIVANEQNGDIFYSSTESLNKTNLKRFTVYPNPVSAKLNLSVDVNAVQAPVTITIYTMNGVKADQFRYDLIPRKLELNISHLPKGTYRVTMNEGAGTKQDQTIIIY